MNNKFIYQKKDFVNIGVPEGSFNGLIKRLDIDNPDYMCFKELPNKINAKLFTEEAMQIVLNYLKDKEKANNQNELILLQQNSELKQQIQQMQNALTLLESRHTQELSEAKDEWHEKEKALIKQSESNKRTAERAEQQLENMEQWNFWQFRSWKKFQKLNKKNRE